MDDEDRARDLEQEEFRRRWARDLAAKSEPIEPPPPVEPSPKDDPEAKGPSLDDRDKPTGFSHPWWVAAGCVVVTLVGAGVAIYVLNHGASEVDEAVYTIASLAAGVAALTLAGISWDAFRRWRSGRRRFTSEDGSEPGKA